jgi:serine protease AprX
MTFAAGSGHEDRRKCVHVYDFVRLKDALNVLDGQAGLEIAESWAMRSLSTTIRRKVTWGSRRTWSPILILVLALIVPQRVDAASGPGKGNAAAQLTAAERKLDRELRGRGSSNGESDVIVQFTDNRDDSTVIRGFGKAGRRLNLIQGRVLRIPNGLLKRLAEHPRVKQISLDRPATGDVGRTAATIGSRAVVDLMGYTGAGIGVAVIDSGISNWHDDFRIKSYGQTQPSLLTLATTSLSATGLVLPTNQRIAHFKDFVNGRTAAYDDWGHGTHVSGIIAGNGYDSRGVREAIAPGAHIVALKALARDGSGSISNIIAAIEYAISIKSKYNIRVLNMSLGASVLESYKTDPLTLAAKRAVDAGIVVVASAGNMGKAKDGSPQYGAIGSPGNAPWVLTVGASSTNGTADRRDDTMGSYSSRGPTMIDFNAKPDLVAPGTGTVSLADPLSRLYAEKSGFLVGGNLLGLTSKPYITLSGTSMAAPVVSGTVALMLHANPSLTPNMVKAILQYTSQAYPQYDYLTQGAGFLNARGAVILAEYFKNGKPGDRYPRMKGWARHIFWGNRRITGGVLAPNGTAWGSNVVWGDVKTPTGQNIVWGDNCATISCDNIVWGQTGVWGTYSLLDNIVWGNNIVWGESNFDNIVWGNSAFDNIVWGNGMMENIVWGNSELDNIVWGNDCEGANCDNIVWGQAGEDNIVWGNAEGVDNIVWGNDLENIVWGNTADENVSWGNSTEDIAFGDDTAELNSFDSSVWDSLFELIAEDPFATQPSPSPPPDPIAPTEPTEPTGTTSTNGTEGGLR